MKIPDAPSGRPEGNNALSWLLLCVVTFHNNYPLGFGWLCNTILSDSGLAACEKFVTDFLTHNYKGNSSTHNFCRGCLFVYVVSRTILYTLNIQKSIQKANKTLRIFACIVLSVTPIIIQNLHPFESCRVIRYVFTIFAWWKAISVGKHHKKCSTQESSLFY